MKFHPVCREGIERHGNVHMVIGKVHFPAVMLKGEGGIRIEEI